MTGLASAASRAAALAAGASAYLAKPFAAFEFSALVAAAARGGTGGSH